MLGMKSPFSSRPFRRALFGGAILAVGLSAGVFLQKRSTLSLCSFAFNPALLDHPNGIVSLSIGHPTQPEERICITRGDELELRSEHGIVRIPTFRRNSFNTILLANYPTAMEPKNRTEFAAGSGHAERASFIFKYYTLDCTFNKEGDLEFMNVWLHRADW